MLTTSARPIISAAAVAAVAEVRRGGLRVAFCLASSPGSPRSRMGAAITAVSGRTAKGSDTITPPIATARPSPNAAPGASPYR